MNKIEKHPILEIPLPADHTFTYNGIDVIGQKGFSLAAALHQAGFPIHSHSLKLRELSLECGIGKCGACEMLVDGQIKRICITKVDGINEVQEIPHDFQPPIAEFKTNEPIDVFKTNVVIIGAGPAGLAA